MGTSVIRRNERVKEAADERREDVDAITSLGLSHR